MCIRRKDITSLCEGCLLLPKISREHTRNLILDLNSESRIMGLLFSDTGQDYRTMKNLPFLTSEKKKDWTANE